MTSRENMHVLDDETFKNSAIEHGFSSDISENTERKSSFFRNSSKKTLRSMQKSKTSEVIRPKSSKTSINTIKTKEDIEQIDKETSKQVIRSVYKLISSKFPNPSCKGELSEKDQEEIQEYFLKKKLEFQNILKEIGEINEKNTKKFKKYKNNFGSENILNQKKFNNEILMLKKKNKEFKKELLRKATEKINKKKNFLKKVKDIELHKKKREEKKIQEYEKNIIIENIENFYKDRIVIIKDCIQKEEEIKRIWNYDEKKYAYSLLQEEKRKKLQNFMNLKNKYERKLEELKDKFSLL